MNCDISGRLFRMSRHREDLARDVLAGLHARIPGDVDGLTLSSAVSFAWDVSQYVL